MKTLKKELLQVCDSNKLLGELWQLIDEEHKNLRARKIKKILEQQFILGTLGKTDMFLKDKIDENQQKIKLHFAEINNNRYIWICINPKPGIELAHFQQKVKKMAERKMFVKYLYVFEQRGQTEVEAGKGFHTHILAERKMSYKPSQVKKNTMNSVKGLVGDVNNHHQFQILPIGKEFAEDKKKYILGLKKPEKQQKQKIDSVWRPANNIPRYYGDINIATEWKLGLSPES